MSGAAQAAEAGDSRVRLAEQSSEGQSPVTRNTSGFAFVPGSGENVGSGDPLDDPPLRRWRPSSAAKLSARSTAGAAAVTGAPAAGSRAESWQAPQDAGLPVGEPGDPHRWQRPPIPGLRLGGRLRVQAREPCGDRALIAIRHDQLLHFARGKQASPLVLIADDTRLMCLVATASRLGPGGRRDWRRPGARAAGFPCSRAR